MDFNNLFMELEDKSSMRMEAYMRDNSKMKIKMDMEDRYSKMVNIILVNLKMTRERD